MPNVSTNVKCIGSDEIVTRSQIKTWDIIVSKLTNDTPAKKYNNSLYWVSSNGRNIFL